MFVCLGHDDDVDTIAGHKIENNWHIDVDSNADIGGNGRVKCGKEIDGGFDAAGSFAVNDISESNFDPRQKFNVGCDRNRTAGISRGRMKLAAAAIGHGSGGGITEEALRKSSATSCKKQAIYTHPW